MHHNNLNHLYGRIKKSGKWQARWENFSVFQPNATTYFMVELGEILSQSSLDLEDIQDRKWNSNRVIVLLVSYPATRLNCHWSQKHLRANRVTTQLL